MQPKAPLKLNEQIYQEACEWFVEFRSGDLDDSDRRQFDLWARNSPEHLAAYLEIAAIWNEGSALDSDRKRDAEALIAQSAVDFTNVVPLSDRPRSDVSPTALAKSVQQSHRWHFSPPRVLLAASIAAVSVIAGLLIGYQRLQAPIYTTTFGEERSITLEDGSVIYINSHSKTRIRYTADERNVDLLEGQALFHVAKNPARPFFISSATTQVRAVGTEFDVYQKLGGTVVTVVEGRVAVLSRSDTGAGEVADPPAAAALPRGAPGGQNVQVGGNPPILLSAGEQVLVTPWTMQKADHPNIAIATAWTQRQLEFESASLSDVAE